jgi:Tfp pilus assembly protein PilF
MPLPHADLQRALEHLQRGDWRAAHEIVQQDETSSLSCWLHAIVHLMEGDEANARYWYGAAKRPFPDGADIAAEIRAARKELRP